MDARLLWIGAAIDLRAGSNCSIRLPPDTALVVSSECVFGWLINLPVVADSVPIHLRLDVRNKIVTWAMPKTPLPVVGGERLQKRLQVRRQDNELR